MSMLKRTVSSCVLAGIATLVSACASSHNSPKAQSAAPQPEMSPEMAKMMESWMAYMTPGPEHTAMAACAGRWTMTTRMRFTPSEPWQEGKGTAEFKPAMGGRYMFEKVTAPADATMPEGFEGFNISGYDNFKKKYVFCWVDNMGTGLMLGEGESTDGGKTIVYQCEGPDLVKSATKQIRFVVKHVDHNTIESEMHEVGPDGKEFQSFGATYKRKG